MNRITLPALVGALVLVAGGVAGAHERSAAAGSATARVVVPDVVGLRMDRATRALHQRGLRVNEECTGLFGCIVKARWWICSQSPRAGTRVVKYRVVVIYGERSVWC